MKIQLEDNTYQNKIQDIKYRFNLIKNQREQNIKEVETLKNQIKILEDEDQAMKISLKNI